VFTAETPPTSATVGTAYSYQFQASGSPAPTYALAGGTLPYGLTLNGTSGLLSGTPTTAGAFTFWISASNSAGMDTTPAITVSVGSGQTVSVPSFTAQTPPTSATVGTAYSYQFQASGSPTPTYAYTGTLPPGLGLSASTGLLAGTPTTTGTYSFWVSASNSAGTAWTGMITVSVTSSLVAPSFTAQTPPTSATVGTVYSYQFRASGSPTPTYGYTGTLPPGLGLSASTGLLAGTPTTTGTYSFWVSANNNAGTAWTGMITVSVTSSLIAPSFTAQTPPTSATVGTAYAYQFQVTGNPAPAYSLASGSLPGGLALNGTTGMLSGTPSVSGSFTFTVRASNGVGSPAVTGSITISVAGTSSALTLAPYPYPFVIGYGQSVNYQFAVSGGTAPYSFIWSGNLPYGLTLSSSGLLSGTLLAAPGQDFFVNLMVLDARGSYVAATVWIRVP